MPDHMRVPGFTILLLGAILLFGSEPAGAQSPRTPYMPRPTLSPWLNMYRSDPGPVGPYLSYVRPEQRLRQTLAEQQTRIFEQQNQLDALRRQTTTLESRGAVAPTGVSSTFMNYSHYYNVKQR